MNRMTYNKRLDLTETLMKGNCVQNSLNVSKGTLSFVCFHLLDILPLCQMLYFDRLTFRPSSGYHKHLGIARIRLNNLLITWQVR